MRKILNYFFFLWLFSSTPVFAVLIHNVEAPRRMRIHEQTLQLQGAAYHTKLVFELYAAAFYCTTKVTLPQEALNLKEYKRMWFRFTLDFSSPKIKQLLRKGIEKNNSKEILFQNKKWIDNFVDLFDKDISNGDIMAIDYIPGKGTELSINGKVKGSIPDEQFYKIVLNMWMGEHPPTRQFQRALLSFN